MSLSIFQVVCLPLCGIERPGKEPVAVKAILIAGLAAILGLNVINNVTDFKELSLDCHPAVYQMETLGLSVCEASLIFSIFSPGKKIQTHSARRISIRRRASIRMNGQKHIIPSPSTPKIPFHGD